LTISEADGSFKFVKDSNKTKKPNKKSLAQYTFPFCEAREETEKLTTNSTPQYTSRSVGEGCDSEYGVKEAGERLCQFIDPHYMLELGQGSWWPLVILSFDESHILANILTQSHWTLFSELRCTL